MMRRMSVWLAAAALVPVAAPAPAPVARNGDPTVRALFVAVNSYKFSRTRVAGAELKDLRGAVGDAERMKDALRAAYGLDLDRPSPDGGCRSQNDVSTTLTDPCATRDAVLAALDDVVDRSTTGDTLLFYFAGHGGRITDDQEQDQASGSNSTILPYDARDPDAPTRGDILDRELRDRIDRASARGVNVVTVFDSCHSGTATRDDPGDAAPRERARSHCLGDRRPHPLGVRIPRGLSVISRATTTPPPRYWTEIEPNGSRAGRGAHPGWRGVPLPRSGAPVSPRCGAYGRRQGVGKEVGPRALAQEVDHRLRPGDVAADGPAERLAERAGQDVDAVRHAEMMRRAAPLGTHEARGVAVVDHDDGVMGRGQPRDSLRGLPRCRHLPPLPGLCDQDSRRR